MLKEQTILITGASGGIGLAIAEILLENHAKVILFYNKNQDIIDEFINKHKDCKDHIRIVQVDLLDQIKLEQSMQILLENESIDVFIHSPTFKMSYKDIMKTEWDDYQSNIELQTRSFFQITKQLIPSMKIKKYGKIISILTTMVIGKPPSSLSDHIVGKYSLLGMSKCLAVELGRFGISVNSVSPSMTKTNLTEKLPSKLKEIAASHVPLGGKLAEPKQIASAVLFLCLKSSNYLSGTNIIVSGGETIQ